MYLLNRSNIKEIYLDKIKSTDAVSSTQSIDNIVNSTNVSSNNEGGLVIASCNGIKLENVVIDQSIKVRLKFD